MATNPAPLNKKQVEVLQWIRTGCRRGVFTSGYEHRITARALERRGLIDISGSGPTWSAAITEAGQAWRDAPPKEILTAKGELKKLLEQEKRSNRTVSVETTDKLTEPQIVAKVRDHFQQ